MKQYTDLEYLKLTKIQRFGYKIARFFVGIPKGFVSLVKKIGRFFAKIGKKIASIFVNIGRTFVRGDWKTKTSYFIMGFGNLARGQVLRGLLFLIFEIVFIVYIVIWGGGWLSQMGTLGTQGPVEEYNEILDTYTTVYHDNSFKILLYSVLTLFFIVAFIVTWYLNIEQNRISEEILGTAEKKALTKQYKADVAKLKKDRGFDDKQLKENKDYIELTKKYNDDYAAIGKPIKSSKQDLQSLVDDQFHKTLLALPVVGIVVFTVMPIFFMILVAFTNYDGAHNGYSNNLFHWVGLENFNTMLNWKSGNKAYSAAFGEILAWTIIWAFFATFTNYFLGMFVAIMINKKGIKLKKLWRTILVLTIAIPQFISLLYVSKMFSDNGIVLTYLRQYFHVPETFSFIGTNANKWVARATVIVINIWIGIPYLMLIATGILMNIPEDLYESAKIDGANVWQQYTKITLPYMIFITGPYLLTSFIGNMNNFNVIYLLTGGGPTNGAASGASGSVGYTDLLITWLFKITTGANSEYYMASVIGILVFVVVAFFSIIVYNIMPSTKNEEDFQ